MNIMQTEVKCRGVKFSIQGDNGDDIGRAFLYLMYNDLHSRPFGLMEDVYVNESFRAQGFGTELVKKVITVAKDYGCYKLIANSRYSRSKVHKIYLSLGFEDNGKEFRIDF